jgi:hypothetical protein
VCRSATRAVVYRLQQERHSVGAAAIATSERPCRSCNQEIAHSITWLGSEASPALPALQNLLAEPEALPEPARAKLESVVAELSVDGSCCTVPTASPSCAHNAETALPVIHQIHHRLGMLLDVELEDQDGARAKFGEFFIRKPSVVAFFYTRCDNPNKCSLTITKLASLQRRLAELGLDGQEHPRSPVRGRLTKLLFWAMTARSGTAGRAFEGLMD